MALGIAMGIGAAVGGISSIFGAANKNTQAEAAAKRKTKYHKATYEFQ